MLVLHRYVHIYFIIINTLITKIFISEFKSTTAIWAMWRDLNVSLQGRHTIYQITLCNAMHHRLCNKSLWLCRFIYARWVSVGCGELKLWIGFIPREALLLYMHLSYLSNILLENIDFDTFVIWTNLNIHDLWSANVTQNNIKYGHITNIVPRSIWMIVIHISMQNMGAIISDIT